ncbi:MAG: substrate-binding domain-containing protein, partial [Lachnospiraceae bacterium]|nr:substrate-binding domain-containing protein [Lachnospiraceae bacterium]
MAPFYKPVEAAARAKAKELEQYGAEVVFYPLRLAADDFTNLQETVRRIREDWDTLQGWAMPGLSEDFMKLLLPENWNQSGEKRPVVYYNLDAVERTGWDRIGVVGCDYEQAGRIACGLAARMTGGRGKVLFVTADDGTISSSAMRISGFQKNMEQAYPQMQVCGKVFTENLNYSITEALAVRYIRENPEINVVYIANPGNYSICELLQKTAVETVGGMLCIITNDLIDSRQEQMLKEGIIAATICQEPERQGARPLQILFDRIAYGKDPEAPWEKTNLEIVIGESLPE